MKISIIPLMGLLLSSLSAQSISTNPAVTPSENLAPGLTIPVDSPSFVFSPANWTGDEGRVGKKFRQSWNPYAYFRVVWESSKTNPSATILLDTSGLSPAYPPPSLAYCIDGVWRAPVASTNEICLPEIGGSGAHTLEVHLVGSQQRQRWGSDGTSGLNVVRVTGLRVDAGSTPLPGNPAHKWALIIGDSITEGSGTSALCPYSHLLGRALRTRGYEYGISACGYSGWLKSGDQDGDVPGYYMITASTNGNGGRFEDTLSRWNKIDGNRHPLLDTQGHLSANGETGQEPSLILINYGTNDFLRKSNTSDLIASITRCLAALRAAAPDARIVLLLPFGQYEASEIRTALANHRLENPADTKTDILDLGAGLARNLENKNGPLGGLHPNDRGHAMIAAELIPRILTIVDSSK